jgi:ACR3 family arsenite transporter
MSPMARAALKQMNIFERYLSLWVALCMAAGMFLGRLLPGTVRALQRMEFGTGSQINIPMAVLIWL